MAAVTARLAAPVDAEASLPVRLALPAIKAADLAEAETTVKGSSVVVAESLAG